MPGDLIIAPYLPLGSAKRVGRWRLIPFSALGETDEVPDNMRRPVERLIAAYAVEGATLGAIAYPEGSHVGAAIARDDQFRILARSLLAGTIAPNTRLAVSDTVANAGWMIATSENAVLYGHPNVDGISYAVERGMLARVADLRYAPGDDPLPQIDPPPELPRPLLASTFDEEVGDAAYRLQASAGEEGSQLAAALDRYQVVFTNTSNVPVEVRVSEARSALEALLGRTSKTKRVVRAYGRLVGTGETPVANYHDVRWKPGRAVQLSADERWLDRLNELRNAIVHPEPIPDELWYYEGHHQVNQIHDRLIEAMLAFLARHGPDPYVALSRFDRALERAAAQYQEQEQSG